VFAYAFEHLEIGAAALLASAFDAAASESLREVGAVR
jgi:hypothetical protein